jgi:excisionase family DNA binding protein
MPAEPYLTVAEVATRLAISDECVLGLIRAHRLRAANVGLGARPRWRIAPDDLAAFLAARTAAPNAQTRSRKRRSQTVTNYF